MKPSDTPSCSTAPSTDSKNLETEEKLERLRKKLLVMIRRQLGSRYHHLAEDLVQEALTRVLEKLGPDGLAEASPGLLSKTAYHIFVDDFRRSSRVQFLGPESIDVPPTQQPSQDRALADQRLSALVVECLKSLASARRQAVVLKLFGFSAKDSARILGRTVRQIRNHIFRGLTNLRRCLDKKGVRD